jgi:hypothetical protein
VLPLTVPFRPLNPAGSVGVKVMVVPLMAYVPEAVIPASWSVKVLSESNVRESDLFVSRTYTPAVPCAVRRGYISMPPTTRPAKITRMIMYDTNVGNMRRGIVFLAPKVSLPAYTSDGAIIGALPWTLAGHCGGTGLAGWFVSNLDIQRLQ